MADEPDPELELDDETDEARPWWCTPAPGEFADEKVPDAEEQAALDAIRRDYGPPLWGEIHYKKPPEMSWQEFWAHERHAERSAAARRAAQTRKRHRVEAASAVAAAEAILRAAQAVARVGHARDRWVRGSDNQALADACCCSGMSLEELGELGEFGEAEACSTMADMAAQHLTFHGGRYTWTGWTLRPLAGGGSGICVPCDLGAHWLTQHSDGSLVVGVEPFAWATPAEAYAAVERYELQQKREPS